MLKSDLNRKKYVLTRFLVIGIYCGRLIDMSSVGKSKIYHYSSQKIFLLQNFVA